MKNTTVILIALTLLIFSAVVSAVEDQEPVITDMSEPERCLSCLLYTSPSPRDRQKSRMPSSA